MTKHVRHALLVLVSVVALCAEAMPPRGAAGYASGNAQGQRRTWLTSDHSQSQALHQRQHTTSNDEKPSSTSSSRSSTTPQQAKDDTLQASIQIAARQALFDYATQQGLAMLVQRVTGLAVPDVTKTFHLPVIGDFELHLYTIRVQEFTVPHEDARLVILDKFFNLWVEQVGMGWHRLVSRAHQASGDWVGMRLGRDSGNAGSTAACPAAGTACTACSSAAALSHAHTSTPTACAPALLCLPLQVSTHVTFDWHWEKPGLGIQGTGDGELFLRNGVINYVFSVAKSDETSRPKLDVKVADSFFESTDVRIHAFAADWLYQAVLSLFNERINTAINKGIARALSDDVPSALDNVLASLPTRVDIKGLPFVTAFDYSIYTYSYVLLKGYGEVEAPTAALGQAGQVASSGADVLTGAGAGAGEGTEAGGLEQQQQQQRQAQQQVLLGAAATTPSASLSSTLATPDASSSQLQRCPFAASELPISGQALASEPHMVTLYLHESLLNCMAWGMFNAGSLKFSVVDGTIPKLHLTTDLMAMLIPQLPKTYPHQLMRIDAEALCAPTVRSPRRCRSACVRSGGGKQVVLWWLCSADMTAVKQGLAGPQV